jgi:hypothetical protein
MALIQSSLLESVYSTLTHHSLSRILKCQED